MRGWQTIPLLLVLLRSCHGHCLCHDEDHGSFSLEFSEEVSLSGDLSDLPFVIHHHHHHHDLSDLFSSEFFDSDEHHGSFHEELSEELELEIEEHEHSHSHEHEHEHHHHEHEHDHSDFSPDLDDLLFYYRK